MESSDTTPTCGFEGNSDMYGLGIRLGIYMQWLSAILCNALLTDPTTERGIMNTALVYNVALLVVVFLLLKPGASDQATYAVEFLPIFLFIVNGYLTAFGFTFSRAQVRDIKLRGMFVCMQIQAIANQVIMPIALLYYSWFWIWAFDRSFLETPCGTSMFLMARLHGRGLMAARVAYGIICVLFGIYTGLIMVVYIFVFPDMLLGAVLSSLVGEAVATKALRSAWLSKFFRFHKALAACLRSITFGFTGLIYNPDDPDTEEDARNKINEEATSEDRIPRGPAVLLISLTTIFSILAIELTLYWNHIEQVYVLGNTGQLIPFIIGILGLCQCATTIIRDRSVGLYDFTLR
ncbi:hypothetical protein B0T14DRAFT_198914 [Immersiella caudata]|uniref:Uncharacterized protein n=1 Tax=Immersiella caudata TaxID=314043 RepID=A0AA39WP55_9PEZI|nr:hypothetical protein B0T14DRAFT_198914 [Immersiella caudata]